MVVGYKGFMRIINKDRIVLVCSSLKDWFAIGKKILESGDKVVFSSRSISKSENNLQRIAKKL